MKDNDEIDVTNLDEDDRVVGNNATSVVTTPVTNIVKIEDEINLKDADKGIVIGDDRRNVKT